MNDEYRMLKSTLTWTFVIDYFSVHHSSGTGSYPCPPPGLHLLILLMDNHPPLNNPCFCKASTAYCEQVGVNLHLGPIFGEITY